MAGEQYRGELDERVKTLLKQTSESFNARDARGVLGGVLLIVECLPKSKTGDDLDQALLSFAQAYTSLGDDEFFSKLRVAMLRVGQLSRNRLDQYYGKLDRTRFHVIRSEPEPGGKEESAFNGLEID